MTTRPATRRRSRDYTLSTDRTPARLVPDYSKTWPTARSQPDTATITFIAGYGAAADVPDDLKHAMKLLIGHWFANREAVAVGTLTVVPIAFSALIDSYRLGDTYTDYHP